MKIEPQHVVSLTYDLYVDQNGTETLTESATQEQPLTFLFGAGQMLPKFEENLSSLSTGDTYEFRLSAQDAYGEYDEEAVAGRQSPYIPLCYSGISDVPKAKEVRVLVRRDRKSVV